MRLGAELPFAAAAALALTTGAHVGASTIRRATIASGAAARQLELEFVAEAEAGTAPTPAAPAAPLQVSVDGSMVPLVGGEWKEVRLATIGVLALDAAGRASLGRLSHVAALASAEAFGREALGEVVRRGVDQAAAVVAVGDGAPWIQGFLDLHCPQARRVLDFAHAAGYLAAAATRAFGPETEPARAWFAAQRHELRHGDPDRVLAALVALPAGEARDTALRYLGERRPMIAYRAFAAAGWPIGSGCVESAHKSVVQARLKRSGMHWTPEAVAPMLALRVTLANGRWEETWPTLVRQRRAARRHRSAARRRDRRPPAPVAARPGPPPPPPGEPAPVSAPPRRAPLQNAPPPADHPWRRPFLRPFPTPATKT